MTRNEGTVPSNQEGELERLLLECMEQVERDGPGAIEVFCGEHPAHADALRSAIRPLMECGVLVPSTKPPQRIGDFEILREVGRGGMGVVFEARQMSLGRRVALKVMLAHLTLDDATIERFRREGQTVAALQHRGIVQVHTVGAAAGHHYIAMEFVEGAPLDRVLERARSTPVGRMGGSTMQDCVLSTMHRMSPTVDSARPAADKDVPSRGSWPAGYVETVVRIAADVADALECAHRAGVVHRDVKPSNILIRPDSSPVLTDFGLARRADLPGLTRTGAFAGTPYYASPEQVAARGAVDHRTDVFSLGATLYELLTLQRPFDGESSQEVLSAIQTREPIDPQKHNPALAPDIVAVVLKALEKDPARRYRTAAQLAEDLRAFLAYEPVQARRVSRPERLRRWVVRKPLHAALVAILSLGIPTVAALGGFYIADRPLVLAAERQVRHDRAEAALMDAYIALGEQRIGDALLALDTVLQYEPANVEGLAGKAYALLQSARHPAAAGVELLEGRAELLQEHRALQRVRALCLVATDRREEGEAELERLGEPEEPLEAFWAGMRLLGRAMARDSEEDTRRCYEYLRDAVIMSPAARPGFLYHFAAAAGELGDERTARTAARALEALWPESGYSWLGIGLALHEVDPDRAAAAYRRAMEYMPGSTGARNNLANALLNAGKVDEAISELRALLAEQPDYGIGHFNLGRILFARKREPEAALPHLRRGVELSPDTRSAHHYLIWVLSVLDRKDEAIAAVHAGLEHHPDDSLLYQDLANVHLDAGAPGEALTAARQAVSADPDDPGAQAVLAEAHDAMGDPAAARACYERRIELLPEGQRRNRAREDLAWFLLRTRDGQPPLDPVAALGIAEALDEATGSDPWLLNLLTEALRLNDRRSEALDVLERGLSLAENHSSSGAKNLAEVMRKRREAIRKEIEAGRR